MSSLGALFVDLAYTPTCLVWSTFCWFVFHADFLIKMLERANYANGL